MRVKRIRIFDQVVKISKGGKVKYELDKNSGLIKVQCIYLIEFGLSPDPLYSCLILPLCAFVIRFEKKKKSDY